LTLSKKVYVFNHQQLMHEFFFLEFKVLIMRSINIFVLFCLCKTILYEVLLKIQHNADKMRTILPLILIGFLRVRLSDF